MSLTDLSLCNPVVSDSLWDSVGWWPGCELALCENGSETPYHWQAEWACMRLATLSLAVPLSMCRALYSSLGVSVPWWQMRYYSSSLIDAAGFFLSFHMTTEWKHSRKLKGLGEPLGFQRKQLGRAVDSFLPCHFFFSCPPLCGTLMYHWIPQTLRFTFLRRVNLFFFLPQKQFNFFKI